MPQDRGLADDLEPYVADPLEPRPRPALLGARLWVAAGAVAVVLLGLAFLAWPHSGNQDPSLEVPEEPTRSLPDT